MLIGATPREPTRGALPWPAALIVWGPGAISSSHAHHCVQLVFALRGTLRARQRPRSRWRTCGAVFIAPDAAHEIDATGAPVLIAFIDPESELAAVTEPRETPLLSVAAPVVARWRRALGNPRTLDRARVEAWVRSDLLRERTARRVSAGVRRVLTHLDHEALTRRHVSLERLAEIAGLSPSRFMHVFTESIGTPLRPYLLWRRVQRASAALAAGRPITEAAHDAGFADAAHMTRTFRRMLGATPTALMARAPSSNEVRVGPAARSQNVQDTGGRPRIR